MSERPTTTGESAKRQVDEGVEEPRARDRAADDQQRADDPEDRVDGTAIAVIISVSLNACDRVGRR